MVAEVHLKRGSAMKKKELFTGPLENIQMVPMDKIGDFAVRPGLYERSREP